MGLPAVEFAEHPMPSLELPPLAATGDSTPSSKELAFRRLLFSTESQLASLQQEEATVGQPAQFGLTAAKLRHFLASLEDQLGDLDRMQGTLRLSPDRLALYQAHVKQLATQLPPLHVPRFCQKPARKAAVPLTVSATSLAETARVALSTPFQPESAHGASDRTAAGSSHSQRAALSLGSKAKQQLREQEQLQDHLTDELASMAAAMKTSAIELQGAVKARGDLVDATEAVLDKNAAGARALAEATKQQYKRSGSTFCLTCMVLLLVGGVLAVMLVYIKLTYFMGFRAQRASYSGGIGSWLGAVQSMLPRRQFDDGEF